MRCFRIKTAATLAFDLTSIPLSLMGGQMLRAAISISESITSKSYILRAISKVYRREKVGSRHVDSDYK